ncbi:dual specificity protein phosphatase family protein [Postechiella marina]|uniref:Dual specificity protein phosphatase family protein n=1 Tax=Postechiella marina TaxID=943941 RepID=A0ABP8C832_9FLAO
MKTTKKIIFSLLTIAIVLTSFHIYQVHFNYRFKEIAEGKVFQSGVIPPHEIKDYITKYNIKTIIDLRLGSVIDPLNPSLNEDIIKEHNAVSAIKGVRHVNLPSKQIPNKENLEQFFNILDNDNSYPVLIHCYHGIGRAGLYSALYRIKYEGLSNEEARKKTKFITFLSSFDHGTSKGEWLKNYNSQEEVYKVSTITKTQ